MAKELIRASYRDAEGILQRTETYFINLRHGPRVNCDCVTKGGTPKRGRPHKYVKTTGTNDIGEAKRALDAHKKSIANDRRITRSANEVTFGEVFKQIKAEYERKGGHLPTLAARLAHLTPYFGVRQMAFLQPSDLDAYIAHRRKANASGTTVNREIEVIARAYSVASDHGVAVPFRVRRYRFDEKQNVRTGFFTDEQFNAVMRHLTHTVVRVIDGKPRLVRVPAPDLRLACAIAYNAGWRKK